MEAERFCSHCGAKLDPKTKICTECGKKNHEMRKSKTAENVSSLTPSKRSASTTLVLCLIFGSLGAHRFYVGKIWTGLLMLFTFGGGALWILVDAIALVNNQFEDKEGHLLIVTKHPSVYKKAWVNIGAVIVWLFMSLLTLVLIVAYYTGGLIRVIDHQLEAIRAGDMEKAYSYTSQDFQKATSLQAFKQFVAQYPTLKNNSGASFDQRQIQNNIGIMTGVLYSSTGEKTPATYQLVNEYGTWKILGLVITPPGNYKLINHDNAWNIMGFTIIPPDMPALNSNTPASTSEVKTPTPATASETQPNAVKATPKRVPAIKEIPNPDEKSEQKK